MRARSGTTTLLMMFVILSLLALGVVFAMRLQVQATGTRAQQERLASLWLARSAITSGVTGTSTVKLAVGVAVVTVSTTGDRREAVVSLNKSQATVTSAQGSWTERFDRAD